MKRFLNAILKSLRNLAIMLGSVIVLALIFALFKHFFSVNYTYFIWLIILVATFGIDFWFNYTTEKDKNKEDNKNL